MTDGHRCEGCIRPICMKKLTLLGCNDHRIEEITGESLNPIMMHDLYMG